MPEQHDVRVAQAGRAARRRVRWVRGPASQLLELGHVDRDREGADLDPTTVQGQIGHRALRAEQAARADGQVLDRAPTLESDDVGAEDPAQDLLPPRQPHEQLLGREGDVEEEADAQVGAALAQERRDQLQVVVVHPDVAPGAAAARRRLGEALVDA